ncbi:MAG: hypothetical protein KIT54_03640 [Phycisphaeraceae bacterium]|nr:hypothetical protein [Phycisphaeraceae bacterium]
MMTQTDSQYLPRITLYGPTALSLGLGVGLGGSALGSVLAWMARLEGDSLLGGIAAAGLLMGTWLLGWMVAFLTGPYQPATAGMAWLAISSARLFVLVVGAIALALVAPTMGLGLWLALLLGGLGLVATDVCVASRTFRHHGSIPMRQVDLNCGEER